MRRINYAKMLNEMIPCAESVKFSNSGTEAVMKAMMIARGYTGRQKIVKLEGGYNCWQDTVAVSFNPDLKKAGPEKTPHSVHENAGILRKAANSTIIMPYSDLETVERIIKRNRKNLTAVLVKPIAFNMGCVDPHKDSLMASKARSKREA